MGVLLGVLAGVLLGVSDFTANRASRTVSSVSVSRTNLAVSGLPTYADNAAALAGGLTAGDFYHTSGTVKVVF